VSKNEEKNLEVLHGLKKGENEVRGGKEESTAGVRVFRFRYVVLGIN
jgi:hypothetical protein